MKSKNGYLSKSPNSKNWFGQYPIPSEEVLEYYYHVSPVMLDKMMEIRTWIYELSEADQQIGLIQECLKWGEPSFLTPITKSGSTIRMAKVDDTSFALYFNCKTSIANEIAIEFPEFNCDGKRALYFTTISKLPKTKMMTCLKKALLYHKRNIETER